jgi:uncharacterized membrane-anchored protein
MKRIHMPTVDARYWLSITLASVFGTNLGDFYAHESGLGIWAGLLVLAVLAGATFLAERRDRSAHEVYYWLVIIIIRTGATNIADYLAFGLNIPAIPLSVALGVVIAVLAWRMAVTETSAEIAANRGLPDTDGRYWTAMLSAGVFGTVLGDVCSHYFGEGYASIGLGLLLAVVLLGRWRGLVAAIAGYWITVAIARTAGTAMGDWLAENKILDIGLSRSTMITGALFLVILLVWRSKGAVPAAPALDTKPS